jgi:hypothetical protein
MDLRELTPSLEDIVVELVHPVTGDVLENDDGSVMTITLLAPHSKEYKKAQHEQITKQLNKAQKDKNTDIDYSEIEQSTLSVLAKTTKAWNIQHDGKKPKLTEDKAKSIYEEVFWIKEQLEAKVSEALAFMKG